MLTANDVVKFWGDDDVVDFTGKIIFLRNPDNNPIGAWPGAVPSFDELLDEVDLARISYVEVTTDPTGARKTVVVLAGRIILAGTIFTENQKWRLRLSKTGFRFASNHERARIISHSVRVRHCGISCLTNEQFGRSYGSDQGWQSGEKYADLVDLVEGGMPQREEYEGDDAEEIEPLAEGEEEILETLQQFVEAEYYLEEQDARETPPFAYTGLKPAAREVVFRQFFTVTIDKEDLERLRELKPTLLKMEGADDIAVSVVNLFPFEEKPEITLSVEKQVEVSRLPRSGRLWRTAIPVQKNVRENVVQSLRDRQSPNKWLLPVCGGTHEYRRLIPARVQIPPSDDPPPNPSQLKAINAGGGTDDYLLVLGPPGTGKTTVILTWVQHFVAQGKRVLISSQNNKAVDNVLERLAKQDLQCVRLGDETKVSEKVAELLIDNYAVRIQEKLVGDVTSTLSALERYELFLKGLLPLLDRYGQLEDEAQSVRERYEKLRNGALPEVIGRLTEADDQVARSQEAAAEIRQVMAQAQEALRSAEQRHPFVRFFLKGAITARRRTLVEFNSQLKQVGQYQEASVQLVAQLEGRLATLRTEIATGQENEAALLRQAAEVFVGEPPERVITCLAPPIVADVPLNRYEATARVKAAINTYSNCRNFVTAWRAVMTGERQQALYGLLLSFVDVVGATCIGINTNKAFKDTRFDVVIVDESGQIQLHNVMVPLSRGPKAILVGDHKQLPPVVGGALVKEVEERGSHFDVELLRKSWFEVLWDQSPQDRKVMLDTQFRCPAVISNFISRAYYDNEYFAGSEMEKKEPLFPFFRSTLVFIDTSHVENRFEQNVAKVVMGNPTETALVLAVLRRALKEKPELGAGKIGIIVPYKNHAVQIRDAIRKEKRRGGLPTLTTPLDELVATVDSFQGQERQLVIFPLTRSNSKGDVGFLKEWRRLNVAMTRAKQQLVMIGDLYTLTSIRRGRRMDATEQCFRESMVFLRNYVREHGQLVDANRWISGAPKRREQDGKERTAHTRRAGNQKTVTAKMGTEQKGGEPESQAAVYSGNGPQGDGGAH